MPQSPHERYEAALRQALRFQGLSPEAVEADIEARRVEQEIAVSSPALVKTSPSPSKTGCTVRNPANRLWVEVNQRETFMHQLRMWASNHDSSAYFHGSISLPPQGAMPEEMVELGRSVNCLLFDASTSDPPTRIVIRLYQSKHLHNNAQISPKKEIDGPSGGTSKDARNRRSNEKHQTDLVNQQHQSVPTYHLVVRSGSGWLPARQFLNKHHFSTRAKEAKKAQARSLARAAALRVLPRDVPALLADLTARANALVNQVSVPAPPATSHVLAAPPSVKKSQTSVTETEFSASGKDVVKISPLFRPFSRLPRELQDEILYQAIEYTRKISIYRANTARDASLSSDPPITISKLFQISRVINERIISHIFRSTNFQFGITGFTNFLWQIGPTKRSYLQNLTFRFGKTSLLHCVRWLAPDLFWELFQPPVATNPPSLTYFWRCQIRDLTRELTLLTLTIDITDVPLTDVPLLVRVLKSAMGSVRHIRVIDKLGSAKELNVSNQASQRRSLEYQENTWRELALRYHVDYKHLRWYMRQELAPYDLQIDVRPVLDEWMNQNRDFFDA
jgi:hypothetical protein